jgi:hypothetical protein
MPPIVLSASKKLSFILKKGQLLSVLRDAGSLRKVAVGGVVQKKNLPRCTRRDALERRRSTSGISDSRVGIDRHVGLRACGTAIDAKTYGLNARQGQVGDAGRVRATPNGAGPHHTDYFRQLPVVTALNESAAGLTDLAWIGANRSLSRLPKRHRSGFFHLG